MSQCFVMASCINACRDVVLELSRPNVALDHVALESAFAAWLSLDGPDEAGGVQLASFGTAGAHFVVASK